MSLRSPSLSRNVRLAGSSCSSASDSSGSPSCSPRQSPVASPALPRRTRCYSASVRTDDSVMAMSLLPRTSLVAPRHSLVAVQQEAVETIGDCTPRSSGSETCTAPGSPMSTEQRPGVAKADRVHAHATETERTACSPSTGAYVTLRQYINSDFKFGSTRFVGGGGGSSGATHGSDVDYCHPLNVHAALRGETGFGVMLICDDNQLMWSRRECGPYFQQHVLSEDRSSNAPITSPDFNCTYSIGDRRSMRAGAFRVHYDADDGIMSVLINGELVLYVRDSALLSRVRALFDQRETLDDGTVMMLSKRYVRVVLSLRTNTANNNIGTQPAFPAAAAAMKRCDQVLAVVVPRYHLPRTNSVAPKKMAALDRRYESEHSTATIVPRPLGACNAPRGVVVLCRSADATPTVRQRASSINDVYCIDSGAYTATVESLYTALDEMAKVTTETRYDVSTYDSDDSADVAPVHLALMPRGSGGVTGSPDMGAVCRCDRVYLTRTTRNDGDVCRTSTDGILIRKETNSTVALQVLQHSASDAVEDWISRVFNEDPEDYREPRMLITPFDGLVGSR